MSGLIERLRYCDLCRGTKRLTDIGCPVCVGSIKYEAADKIERLRRASVDRDRERGDTDMTCTTHHHACDCREDLFARTERRNAELHARLEGAAIALAELNVEAARLAYWSHADVSERVALAQMPDAIERNALIDARRKSD